MPRTVSVPTGRISVSIYTQADWRPDSQATAFKIYKHQQCCGTSSVSPRWSPERDDLEVSSGYLRQLKRSGLQVIFLATTVSCSESERECKDGKPKGRNWKTGWGREWQGRKNRGITLEKVQRGSATGAERWVEAWMTRRSQQCDHLSVEHSRQRLKGKAGVKLCRALKASVRILALIQVTLDSHWRV